MTKSNINLEIPGVEKEEEDVMTFWLLLYHCFIIIGGAIPFVPQYLEILKTGDSSGFSIYVCLVVIVSNVLRIAYWCGHWFDNTLLYQSIIMTCVMIMILELILRTERSRAVASETPFRESRFRDFEWESFWKWTELVSYIEFIVILLVISCAYAWVFQGQQYWIEPLGYLALMTEAVLGIPQIYENYRRQSTDGMNVLMIVLWTVGDAIKAFFFFYTKLPIPFRMCAVIQLLMDSVIFYQVSSYANDVPM